MFVPFLSPELIVTGIPVRVLGGTETAPTSKIISHRQYNLCTLMPGDLFARLIPLPLKLVVQFSVEIVTICCTLFMCYVQICSPLPF